MKTRILTAIGVCYVAFAIVASSGPLDAVDSTLPEERSADKLVQEDRRSDLNSQRLPGPERNRSSKIFHGWLPTPEAIVPRRETEEVEGETIQFKPNCLILWTAEWCPHCKDMKPVVRKLKSQGYTVYVLDFDENRELAASMGVRSLPTSIIHTNSVEVNRYVGTVSEATIKKDLKRNRGTDYEL